eukprot:TRINITY_DN33228_c0_g2_i2.p2 TRINITY_DN33228_c0_g2~~TRINITY_DN33228_c0_g2_i2.p2  ORF type:complete len:252 (-),score=-1.35 TRINITY_DN33228_c0_g2_i2:116-871(-)
MRQKKEKRPVVSWVSLLTLTSSVYGNRTQQNITGQRLKILWHMSHGVSLLLTYWFGGSQRIGLLVLVVLGCVYFAVEMWRLRNPHGKLNQWMRSTFGAIMRPNEIYQINGIMFYLGGVCLSLALFPTDVAVIAILHLAICDPVASFIGKKFGKYTFRYSNGRTVAGTLGSFTSAVVITYIFYTLIAPNADRLQDSYYVPEQSNRTGIFFLSFLSGLGACFGESISVGNLDDNLVLPIVSGTCLYVIICFSQ